MLHDFIDWGGASLPLPLSRGDYAEKEMTLILGLIGKDEVVVAADSEAYDGTPEGLYRFSVSKLHPFGKWLLGFADGPAAYTLHSRMVAAHESFDTNMAIGVHDYAARMKGLYVQGGYKEATSVMAAAVCEGKPSIYCWRLQADDTGKLAFTGVVEKVERGVIGALGHGALYFANAYHSDSLTTSQRIRLAHFCISQATKYDPRVGGTVEVALVKENGVRCFSRSDLAQVERESRQIAKSLAGCFKKLGPKIGGA